MPGAVYLSIALWCVLQTLSSHLKQAQVFGEAAVGVRAVGVRAVGVRAVGVAAVGVAAASFAMSSVAMSSAAGFMPCRIHHHCYGEWDRVAKTKRRGHESKTVESKSSIYLNDGLAKRTSPWVSSPTNTCEPTTARSSQQATPKRQTKKVRRASRWRRCLLSTSVFVYDLDWGSRLGRAMYAGAHFYLRLRSATTASASGSGASLLLLPLLLHLRHLPFPTRLERTVSLHT